MDKWEYTVFKVETKGMLGGILDAARLEEELNRFGEKGWELVSSFATSKGYGESREVISIFKRKK